MKPLLLAATTCILFMRRGLGDFMPVEYVCDFMFNPLTSVEPTLNEKNGSYEEIGCTINNPSINDYIAMICPKKTEEKYRDIELVPANCFESHLYSPYKSQSNENYVDKIGIEKKLAISKSFKNFDLRIFVIPNIYNQNKTIYCRCDNKKTEEKKENFNKTTGKIGLVKIILNNKNNKPKVIDLTGENKLSDFEITRSIFDKIIKINENEIIHFRYPENTEIKSKECDNLINTKFSLPTNTYISLRLPTVFLSNINCKIEIIISEKKKIFITLKADKTEYIDGCDFTKPYGEGIFKNGFILNNINNEKICTVNINFKKKNIVAGLKCPYNLIPNYCFRHVLYQKNFTNEKNFETFLLDDILLTKDIEYYRNINQNAYIVGFPTKPLKSATIRCICEQGDKKGIMEIKIASSQFSFLSILLLLFIISILSIC
ncbi:6-cysteine protein, putative [Plasmodium ovale]|uniref:6-cysteine protein n=2 Tax=Plasmodium ovale TaxID=36330 RepID=A0A1A8WRM2_PLAOA|nr:6-cysteine protein [Plasmodium ovale curtisi]SBS96100.1 6-cysteine protein [Plasmodium ovale curtisi]SCP05305.1 6-cysteine protein, putative [Plasmodium ovale]